MEKSTVNFRSIAYSVLISLAVTAVLLLFFAVVLYATSVSDSRISDAVFAITVAAVMSGGIAAARNAEKSGFLYGTFVALGYFAVVFLCALAVNRNAALSIGMLIKFVSCVAAGMLGGIIGINTKTSKKHRKKIKIDKF